MRKLASVLIMVTALTLLACSNKQSAPAKPMDAKDTVFGSDIKALEKAKTVQDTLNKDKANLDKSVEANDSKLPVSTD